MATDREYAALTVPPGTCGWKTGTAGTGPLVCGRPSRYRAVADWPASVNGEVCGVHRRKLIAYGGAIEPLEVSL